MWCHLPTSIGRRRSLRFIAVAFMFVALITTLVFASVSHAAPGTSKTISFQGRLMTAAGAVVADGHYNMQFKIYQGGTGTAAGNPGGTLNWTETYINNGGTSGVEVKNGFFSVNLGSVNAFGTSVDWNQDTLFLSMNVAGNATACTTFDSAPCAADGEMLPMKRITATPYSINSGAVGGKTADNFVQLGQGVQTDVSSNTSSIFINKTGSGNLMQLQSSATNVLTVTNAGDLVLGNNANHSLAITTSAADTAGRQLSVAAGAGGTGAAGGDLILQGGGAGSATGNGSNGPNAINSEAFESQPNGTVISTSNTIFDTIFTNGTANFSNEWSINGGLSAKYVTQNNAFKRFTATNQVATRWYMMLPSTPVNNTSLGQTTLSAAITAQLSLFTNGTVRLRNGTIADGTATSVLPTNTPIRVEWKIDSTGGTQEARFYWGANLHGTTPNTATSSSSYAGGNIDAISTGVNISATGFTMYVDEWAYGSDWIGPLQYGTTNGGSIQIDGGAKTGTGSGGSIYIGATNANAITIGSSSAPISQDISVGANNTAGSTSNVTIGSGGSANGGSTTIQAKNAVTIKTNGTTRATFSDTTNTVYFGNGVAASAPNNYTIQGTNSSATAVAGGSLTVQGGSATTGNANGGNVTLSGGAGSGTGAAGLVVLKTPTFSTVTNDANCYTSGALVASNCTITVATVDSSSAVLVGFSATGQTATLPDPTIKTAGRIIYVMAAGSSKEFTLTTSGGATTTLRQNTTVGMLWNGTVWTIAGGSSSTTLQNAYDNTPQSAAGTELTLNNSTATGGLTIRDSSTNPIKGTLLEVKNTTAQNLLSINGTDSTSYQADGKVNNGATFTANWLAVGSATASRITTDGQEGGDSARVIAGTAAGSGIRNKLAANPAATTQYHVSTYVKLISGSALTDFTVRYSPDGGTTFVDCINYNNQTVTTGWTRITCLINTTSTTVTNPYVSFTQPTTAASGRTFLADNFSFTQGLSTPQNVQVGTGTGTDQTTLFTVDKSASAPTANDSNALLGSMYYDTTLGKLQCYEAAGWGTCGSSPDIFISLSPTYSNAVTHGAGTGTLSTDLCSDALNINDGTSSQPTICGTNETYNFYKWTSAQTTAQTNDMYVTYQLPSTFKKFINGSALLMGRTDSADSAVTYQIYRNNQTTGLTACGSTVATSTGVQTSWQTAVATSGADPASCGFSGGDSVVFKISFSSKNNANAYISNLNFIYSNH